MAKETITMTRDLFDELLIATATKERERIIKLLTPIKQRFQGKGPEEEIVADTIFEVIELIKGEQE